MNIEKPKTPLNVVLKEEENILSLKSKETLDLSIDKSFTISLDCSNANNKFELLMCGNDLAIMKHSVAKEIKKHIIKNNLPLGCYNVSATIEKGEKWYDSDEFTVEISQTECIITY